jgi:hypothetical protein
LGGRVYYDLNDHLGSSNVLTSATGTIENESDFYPYGVDHVVTQNLSNHCKFTGEERNTESGNDPLGAAFESMKASILLFRARFFLLGVKATPQ